MDPNAALDELRSGVRELRGDAGDRVFQTFEALDNWLLSGGFLPNDWSRRNV